MSTRRGENVNAIAAIAVVLALAIIVNYFGAKYYKQWDVTSGSVFTLSEKTDEIVRGLEQDVRILSFLDEGSQAIAADARDQILTTLDAYRALNPQHIRLDTINPIQEPARFEALLQELALEVDRFDAIVVSSGTRNKHLRMTDLFKLESDHDHAGHDHGPRSIESLTVESSLTAAIAAVTRERQPLVAVATGHGERELYDAGPDGLSRFAETLERQDLTLRPWNAFGSNEIPSGTDLVLIPSPTEAWLEPEVQALRQFLDGGGRVLLWVDPSLVPGRPGELAQTGLESLLEEWGVRASDALIIDASRPIFRAGAEVFYTELSATHPINESLSNELVVYTLARPLEMLEVDGVSTQLLSTSSAESWGETGLETISDGVEFSEADLPGPLPLAVLSERSSAQDGRAGRLITAGDVDVISNQGIDTQSNRTFTLNKVFFLIEEDRSLGIPPKDRALATLFIPDDQQWLLLPLLAFAMPLFIVFCGVNVWWRRRQS